MLIFMDLGHKDGPRLFRELDWIDNVWPYHIRGIQYPQVQLYCLMGVKDSYTDFHNDFGGASVFYHILSGKKILYFIEPTPENLKQYTKWFLGQILYTFSLRFSLILYIFSLRFSLNSYFDSLYFLTQTLTLIPCPSVTSERNEPQAWAAINTGSSPEYVISMPHRIEDVDIHSRHFIGKSYVPQ